MHPVLRIGVGIVLILGLGFAFKSLWVGDLGYPLNYLLTILFMTPIVIAFGYALKG